jgi:hypothetical protein
MTLAPDGLPVSEVGLIDKEIRERIDSYMSDARAPDDLARIQILNRQRVEMTKPKLFEEARALIAEIAAAG